MVGSVFEATGRARDQAQTEQRRGAKRKEGGACVHALPVEDMAGRAGGRRRGEQGAKCGEGR